MLSRTVKTRKSGDGSGDVGKETDGKLPQTNESPPDTEKSTSADETLAVPQNWNETVVADMESFVGFVGHSSLKDDLRWMPIPKAGKMVVDSDGDVINLVAPFKVLPNNLLVGPFGNFSGTYDLKNAKYRFIGGPPTTHALSIMYQDAMTLLKHLEADVTKGAGCKNLFHVDGDSNVLGINFSLPCFFKRTVPYRPSAPTDLETLKSSGGRTKDSESPVHPLDYPIPKEHAKAYEEICEQYAIDVLPVYRGKKLIEPSAMEDTLWNATLRVHFTLTHHYFRDNDYHSIKAEVVNICLIQDSPNGVPTPKKRSFRDGPLTPEKERAFKKARLA